MKYWQDKVVVVTGGSSGLGLVLSQSFAAAGCQVIMAARGQEQGTQAVKTIETGNARFVATDVTDSASVNQLVELLEGHVTYLPKRPGEPNCTFADISKITQQ